jgi:hypothetical protein
LRRTDRQIRADKEDDRREARKEEKMIDKQIQKTIRSIGMATLLAGTLLIHKKYRDKKLKINPPPFVTVKRNGEKGYFNEEKEWFPRPNTNPEYTIWKVYQKKNIGFFNKVLY